VRVEASPAPPTAKSWPGWAFSSRISSATSSLTSLAWPSTVSSVLENTIFGNSSQMRANSRTTGGAAGSSCAVSQYTITS
jgi:hypothetical protein